MYSKRNQEQKKGHLVFSYIICINHKLSFLSFVAEMATPSLFLYGCKGGGAVIVHAPLWRTMAEQKVTTYTLRFKHSMSHAAVH